MMKDLERPFSTVSSFASSFNNQEKDFKQYTNTDDRIYNNVAMMINNKQNKV